MSALWYVDNIGIAMPATRIFEASDEFPTGDRWEAIAWDVPQTIHDREFA